MPREPFEFQPMVDKGFKLLDERLGPEWVEKIDLDVLSLQSNCACILGQTSADITGRRGSKSYAAAAGVIFPDERLNFDEEAAEAHGFVVLDNPANYRALTECWRNTILSRRAEL